MGAKSVHVKDLSLKWSELGGKKRDDSFYFVWKRDEHKRVARPNVKVIRIKQEYRLAMLVTACRHFKFNIFMRNIFLLEIHSRGLESAYPANSIQQAGWPTLRPSLIGGGQWNNCRLHLCTGEKLFGHPSLNLYLE